MPAIKSLIRGNDPDLFMKMLIKTEVEFDLYMSNYAMKVVTNDQIINFTRNEQNRQTFAAFSKLKHDLITKPLPNITANDVTYFLHDFKEPMYIDKVCNIDLKSCYANILYLDKLIEQDTFKYLCKLQKKDRLSAVGMLASKKLVFEFRKGIPENTREERSELAPFFFYAVKRTFEIMSELKKICGKSYLYTWVDGIYFLPDAGIKKECELYLKEIKFPFSSEYLTEFEIRFKPRFIRATFLKEGKRKNFDLPMQDSAFTRIMSNALLLTNSKHKLNGNSVLHKQKGNTISNNKSNQK